MMLRRHAPGRQMAYSTFPRGLAQQKAQYLVDGQERWKKVQAEVRVGLRLLRRRCACTPARQAGCWLGGALQEEVADYQRPGQPSKPRDRELHRTKLNQQQLHVQEPQASRWANPDRSGRIPVWICPSAGLGFLQMGNVQPHS
ncbi:hypothetical protein NDU88_008570 [Pleurodeles waltl]|uniref:Uncharacterized protein n=1 Tax=Pleurodeles waltl TaxID=8319 RepID=A0AAV7RWH1_PLEWA|nr:hypothetical protein NDU88_008570 [Pleurodeles waltl]